MYIPSEKSKQTFLTIHFYCERISFVAKEGFNPCNKMEFVRESGRAKQPSQGFHGPDCFLIAFLPQPPMQRGLKHSHNPDWALKPGENQLGTLGSSGFLMSHHRKGSVRDKVIGKKWIFLERKHSPETECGPSRKARDLGRNTDLSFTWGWL